MASTVEKMASGAGEVLEGLVIATCGITPKLAATVVDVITKLGIKTTDATTVKEIWEMLAQPQSVQIMGQVQAMLAEESGKDGKIGVSLATGAVSINGAYGWTSNRYEAGSFNALVSASFGSDLNKIFTVGALADTKWADFVAMVATWQAKAKTVTG